ncbi:carbohydrate kinase family protein [Nocardia vulneris]|uniref:carbohydrate kinase family protein n=1 Tax=Nocardia vulneris TaxID=1141657 RepID=UPI001FCD23DD|nr:PfkB family carbohydrate kinase [Nocardia vulneris]
MVAVRNILTRLCKRSGLSLDRLRTTEIDVAPLLDLLAVRQHAHRNGISAEEAVLPVVRDLAAQLPPTNRLIADAELVLGLLRDDNAAAAVDLDRLYAADLGERREYLTEHWRLLHETLAAEDIPPAPTVRSLRATPERRAFTALANLLVNESVYDAASAAAHTTPIFRAPPTTKTPATPTVPGVVTVIGDAVIDHLYFVDHIPVAGASTQGSSFEEHPGGKGLSRAVAAARLGLQVRLISAVGDDAAGRRVLQYLRDEGVDTDLVKVVPDAPTPVTAVLITSTGAAGFIGCRDDRIRLSAQDLRSPMINAALASSDAVLLTFEQPSPVLERVLSLVQRLSPRPLLVVHPAPSIGVPQYLYQYLGAVDYLAGTSKDLAAMVPDGAGASPAATAQRLRALGVRSVCAIEDFHCTVWSDRVSTRIPPFPAAMADSPGAQAAFAAALVYRLVSTRRPAEKNDYIWATAAMVATQSFGDVPGSMPPVSDIDRIVRLASEEH